MNKVIVSLLLFLAFAAVLGSSDTWLYYDTNEEQTEPKYMEVPLASNRLVVDGICTGNCVTIAISQDTEACATKQGRLVIHPKEFDFNTAGSLAFNTDSVETSFKTNKARKILERIQESSVIEEADVIEITADSVLPSC